jgi:hypothetical protein
MEAQPRTIPFNGAELTTTEQGDGARAAADPTAVLTTTASAPRRELLLSPNPDGV